eukprot:gene10893-7553_t
MHKYLHMVALTEVLYVFVIVGQNNCFQFCFNFVDVLSILPILFRSNLFRINHYSGNITGKKNIAMFKFRYIINYLFIIPNNIITIIIIIIIIIIIKRKTGKIESQEKKKQMLPMSSWERQFLAHYFDTFHF